MMELPPTQVVETSGYVSPNDLRLTKTFIDVCMKGQGVFKPGQIGLVGYENLPTPVRRILKNDGKGQIYSLSSPPSTYLAFLTPEPKTRNFKSICTLIVPETNLNWVYTYHQISGEFIPVKRRAGLRANGGVAVIPRHSEYKVSVQFRLGYTIVQAAVLSPEQRKVADKMHEVVDRLDNLSKSKRNDKK